MGFETQEQAERWAENMEFRADQRRDEKMLADIERVTDYNRIALEACQKRIAELEDALRTVCLELDAAYYGIHTLPLDHRAVIAYTLAKKALAS